jgi:hypothetical protein
MPKSIDKNCLKNAFSQPLYSDTKSVFSIKESYLMKKRSIFFTNAFGRAGQPDQNGKFSANSGI